MAWQKHSQQGINHGQLLWKGKVYLVITEMLMCCEALNIPHRAAPQRKKYHITTYFAVGINVSLQDEEAHPGHSQGSGGTARKNVSLLFPCLMPCDPQIKGFTNSSRFHSKTSSLTDPSWISHQLCFEHQCSAVNNPCFPWKCL